MTQAVIFTGLQPGSWLAPSFKLASTLNPAAQSHFASWARDQVTSFAEKVDSAGAPALNGFLPHASDNGQQVVLASEFALPLGAELLSTWSGAHLLIVFDPAAAALCHKASGQTLRESLDEWKSSARQAIALLRNYPQSVTLLNATECREKPRAFADLMRERFSLEKWPECEWPAAPDRISHALAALPVRVERETAALLKELRAASCPLAPDNGSLAEIDETDLADEAWQSFNLLQRKSADNLETTRKEIEAIQAQLDSALADSASARKSAETQASTLRDSEAENELLLTQLHQVQEELEAYFLRNLEQRKEIEGLQGKLAEGATFLRSREVERDSALAELGNQRVIATEALRQNGRLNEKLHTAGRTEKLLLLRQGAAFAHLGIDPSAAANLFLQADGVRIGRSRNAAPHKHLNFSLTGCRLRGRVFGDLRMRLIEHHGRPGLVVFHDGPAADAPLWNWQETGSEKGASFMTIIPYDKEGRDYLAAAATSSFLLLQESVALLRSSLEREKDTAADRAAVWSPIATAFLEQCRETPSRLRYDDVVPHLSDGGCSLRIRRAWMPQRYIPELLLHWKGRNLSLLRPLTSRPPLSVWPGGADRVILQLGDSWNHADNRALWARLSQTDREFLSQLVGELPNFARHVGDKAPRASGEVPRLLQDANVMHRNLAKLSRPSAPWWPW